MNLKGNKSLLTDRLWNLLAPSKQLHMRVFCPVNNYTVEFVRFPSTDKLKLFFFRVTIPTRSISGTVLAAIKDKWPTLAPLLTGEISTNDELSLAEKGGAVGWRFSKAKRASFVLAGTVIDQFALFSSTLQVYYGQDMRRQFARGQKKEKTVKMKYGKKKEKKKKRIDCASSRSHRLTFT